MNLNDKVLLWAALYWSLLEIYRRDRNMKKGPKSHTFLALPFLHFSLVLTYHRIHLSNRTNTYSGKNGFAMCRIELIVGRYCSTVVLLCEYKLLCKIVLMNELFLFMFFRLQKKRSTSNNKAPDFIELHK